jgi:hypothetical protein
MELGFHVPGLSQTFLLSYPLTLMCRLQTTQEFLLLRGHEFSHFLVTRKKLSLLHKTCNITVAEQGTLLRVLCLQVSGLENRDYCRRGSAALTIRHPSILKSWH